MKSPSLFTTATLFLVLPLLVGQSGVTSKGGAGCGAGIRSAGSEAEGGTPSGTAGPFASITIQPEEVTTIPPDGDQFYTDLTGVTSKEVTWEISDGNSEAAALKEGEAKASHHALLRGRDPKGRMVRLTPLPEAEHEEWFTLKACSAEKPDLCDTKSVQLLKDDGFECLNGIIRPGDSDPDLVCEARDTAGALMTGDWSQEINAVFGRPVDDSCNGECPDSSAHTPWALTIRHCGSFFSGCKDYRFSFLKDDWSSRVRSLVVERNLNDPDGCPGEGTPLPCWRTCDGSCVAFDVPVKDPEILQAEAEKLLASFLKETCSVRLDPDAGILEALGRALKVASFPELVQCSEGILLAATQVIPWVELVASEGIISDQNGTAYTTGEIFQCLRRSILDGATKNPSPVEEGAETGGDRPPSDSEQYDRPERPPRPPREEVIQVLKSSPY